MLYTYLIDLSVSSICTYINQSLYLVSIHPYRLFIHFFFQDFQTSTTKLPNLHYTLEVSTTKVTLVNFTLSPGYVCMHMYMYVHMYAWCYRRCRKKERHLRQMEKRKWELPQVEFEPTTLCTPDRCSTNWATKAAQLAGFESNISYICMNRLTLQCTCTAYSIMYNT